MRKIKSYNDLKAFIPIPLDMEMDCYLIVRKENPDIGIAHEDLESLRKLGVVKRFFSNAYILTFKCKYGLITLSSTDDILSIEQDFRYQRWWIDCHFENRPKIKTLLVNYLNSKFKCIIPSIIYPLNR